MCTQTQKTCLCFFVVDTICVRKKWMCPFLQNLTDVSFYSYHLITACVIRCWGGSAPPPPLIPEQPVTKTPFWLFAVCGNSLKILVCLSRTICCDLRKLTLHCKNIVGKHCPKTRKYFSTWYRYATSQGYAEHFTAGGAVRTWKSAGRDGAKK